VNLMVDPADADQMARADRAAHDLFEGWSARGLHQRRARHRVFAKAKYLSLELEPEVIALMQRVKAAFDPNGILNPGKIWVGNWQMPAAARRPTTRRAASSHVRLRPRAVYLRMRRRVMRGPV
jgi:hypothetical protein